MSRSAQEAMPTEMTRLRILFVVNEPPLSELCQRRLSEAGFDISCHRVAGDEEQLRMRLSSEPYDIIFAEECLPNCTTTDILRLLREQQLSVLLVLLVDPIKEDSALEYIRKGVWEVIAKDRLGRLGVAAHRALLEQNLRAKWAQMERETELARSVSHDVNNLTTALLGSCDHLLRELGGDGRARTLVEEIRTVGELSASLSNRLLSVHRRQLDAPTVLDLNEVLSNMETVLRRLLRSSVELQVIRAAQALPVRAKRGEIEQLVLNLGLNASEAMPEGGKLTIRIEGIDQDRPHRNLHPTLQPGRYVRLTVSDTGCGIVKRNQARIFEPFFTTKRKANGKARGLGLAVVQAIVKQRGGVLRVTSEPGSGATFEVYLPQVEGVMAEPDTRAVMHDPSGGTVLVVEDEPLLRQVACRALRSFGHKVVEARDAMEAIGICEQERSIDLLVTDVVMPKISGPELATRLKSLQPRLKVLFMTGHAGSAMTGAGPNYGAWLLQKPFKPSALARKVRDILEKGD
jgi:two-component system, cell cycle sensor histidine kinase and response regulator CckA